MGREAPFRKGVRGCYPRKFFWKFAFKILTSGTMRTKKVGLCWWAKWYCETRKLVLHMMTACLPGHKGLQPGHSPPPPVRRRQCTLHCALWNTLHSEITYYRCYTRFKIVLLKYGRILTGQKLTGRYAWPIPNKAFVPCILTELTV